MSTPRPASSSIAARASERRSYFGPFASAGAVGRTINALQKAFLLRTCSDSVFESRTRPCLLYQIKRCSAPCTGEIALADYAGLVAEAKEFLSGKSSDVRDEILATHAGGLRAISISKPRRSIATAWRRFRMSRAIRASTRAASRKPTSSPSHQRRRPNCIQVFFFRTGQNWGNRAYFPRADQSLEPGEVLGAFLAQFYDDKPPPRLMLLPMRSRKRDCLPRR